MINQISKLCWKSIAIIAAIATYGQLAASSSAACSPLKGENRTISDLDVVSFSTKYSKEYISQLKQAGYTGLWGDLDQLIQNQNYIEFLKHLWTEDDLDLALRIIRPYAQQGHAILMLEMSRTLCRKMLTDHQFPPKALIEASNWHLKGLATTELDIACSTDDSTKSAMCELFETYTLPKRTQDELIKIVNPADVYRSFFLDWQLLDPYPSPKWVTYHGLKAYSEDSLAPESEWEERRMARFQQMKMQH
jgi:hypothetical protein